MSLTLLLNPALLSAFQSFESVAYPFDALFGHCHKSFSVLIPVTAELVVPAVLAGSVALGAMSFPLAVPGIPRGGCL